MADDCDVADIAIERERAAGIAAITRYEGVSAEFCIDCDAAIPELRRMRLAGVQRCVECQSIVEIKSKTYRR